MIKLLEKPKQFVQEVRVEMAKVSWPTREELKEATTVVIAVTLMFALFTFSVDRLLTALVKSLYSYLSGS